MSKEGVKLYFLGTAGSTFTGDNFPPCIFVEGYLLDCPAQCPQALVKYNLLDPLHTVLLTHLHVDHSLGLYDLAWHLGTVLSKKRLRLYLPAGGKGNIVKAFEVLGGNLAEKLLGFFEVEEVDQGQVSSSLRVVRARHSVPAVGYRLTLGRVSVCYTGDTAPSEEITEAFKGCDVLIHDSTYPPGMEEQAVTDGHSTPLQAAEVAERVGARVLVLIHLPYARFGRGVREIYLKAAKEIFPNVIVPEPGEVLELR